MLVHEFFSGVAFGQLFLKDLKEPHDLGKNFNSFYLICCAFLSFMDDETRIRYFLNFSSVLAHKFFWCRGFKPIFLEKNLMKLSITSTLRVLVGHGMHFTAFKSTLWATK